MTTDQIVLELSPKLKQAQIVTKYVFDLNNQDIILELNHKYDKKLIVSPIDINDWQDTIQTFKEALEEQEISKDHVMMICDVANSEAPKKLKDKQKKGKQKEKRSFPTYKYSNNFKSDLHETIILGGKPVFIKYNGKTIRVVKSIKEESRIITPPFAEEYAYRPYEFKHLQGEPRLQ